MYKLLIAFASIGILVAQDPKLAAAQAAADDMANGRIAQLQTRFNSKMKSAAPEAQMKTALEQAAKMSGPFQKYIEPPSHTTTGGLDVYVFPTEFKNKTTDMQITIDADGKVAGLYFRGRKTEPEAAVEPEEIPVTEDPITVQTGAFAMPGKLSLPAGNGPFPAIVIVHGSGPTGMDGPAIGPNKPYRDIAWGLAERGVAVLRYDKRTLKYGAQMNTKKVTIKEEAVDDALSAAAMLRKNPKIDPKHVFILGHSLGGQISPYIATLDPKLGGIISLAGNARPVSELVVEQTKYIQSLYPDDKQLALQLAEAEKVKTMTGSPDQLFFGAPLSYWRELDSLLPAAFLGKVSMPILVLQGERDYQVTMADFAIWKKALAGRANAKLISYPEANHLFMKGFGKATPGEYQKPGKVQANLIDDIAKWVKEQR